MSIKHEPTIKRYEELRREIHSALANLQEFAETLPKPTDALHYGYIGPLEESNQMAGSLGALTSTGSTR